MIEVSNLGKDFAGVQVVSDLSITLVPGEILGFLGPNGAGKSTTMKMLTGFLKPSQGSIKIFGHDIDNERIEAQALIGYLPEGAPAYDEMTCEDYLNFIAAIRCIDPKTRAQRVTEVVGLMSLEGVLKQKIETLSKGFKRRVGLAQAIMHDPKVLILDEPTDGLDPNQKHQVRELIRSLSKDKIVIISTHILEEVSAVCSRVIIISDGKLKIDCAPEALIKRSVFHGAVSVEFNEVGDVANLSLELLALPGVERVEILPEACIVYPKPEAEIYADVSKYLYGSDEVKLRSIVLMQGSLEEVFREVTLGGAK